jgi:hypothetical protein
MTKHSVYLILLLSLLLLSPINYLFGNSICNQDENAKKHEIIATLKNYKTALKRSVEITNTFGSLAGIASVLSELIKENDKIMDDNTELKLLEEARRKTKAALSSFPFQVKTTAINELQTQLEAYKRKGDEKSTVETKQAIREVQATDSPEEIETIIIAWRKGNYRTE